ncbi:MAG TPA: hypothetical protein VHD60_00765 [Candidatus Saccharimonadales bacterium]|nr:hypothetical protein [Candidatus Saccharimonadales bacterium]
MSETLSSTNDTYAKMLPEGEHNWGFSIEELPGSHEMHPLEEALIGEGELPALMEENLQNGKITLIEDDGTTQVPEGAKLLAPYVLISRAEYAQGIKEGKFTPNISSLTGKPMDYIANDEARKHGLIHAFPDREKAVLEKVISYPLKAELHQDYLIPGIEHVKGVSQVFELESNGSKVHLYNFSPTLLTGDTLHKAMNAVREVNERSGGALIDDKLKVIAILPESHPRWSEDVTPAAAEKGATRANASTTAFGEVLLNESLLKPQTARPENKARFNVSQNSIEVTLVHELTHVIERADANQNPKTQYGTQVGWEMNQDATPGTTGSATFAGSREFPMPYGQVSPHEDAAETAAAQFTGESAIIDEARLEAINAVYARQHSGRSGPTYLRVHEIDLDTLPQKIGSQLQEPVTFVVRFSYGIKDQEKAA